MSGGSRSGNLVIFYIFVPLVKRQWWRLPGKLARGTGDVGKVGLGRLDSPF